MRCVATRNVMRWFEMRQGEEERGGWGVMGVTLGDAGSVSDEEVAEKDATSSRPHLLEHPRE